LSITPDLLRQAFEKAGLVPYFPETGIASLVQFTQQMLQINESLNLTKWTGDEEVLHYHLLDSALVLPHLKPFIKPGQKWLDLGSGCGFPGVLLLAAFPEAKTTLLDSVAKKTKALQECIKAGEFTASMLTDRAEKVGQIPSHRESYDGVVARAVAEFPVLLEWATPLLKPGGCFVNWVTSKQFLNLEQSKEALQKLQCRIIQTIEYQLPGLEQNRYWIFVEKWGKTPPMYPRRIGRPSKCPL